MTTADPETGDALRRRRDGRSGGDLLSGRPRDQCFGTGLGACIFWPSIQKRRTRVAAEAAAFAAEPSFAGLTRLAFTRDVWREALRLYPPVPMMVREATRPETFRGRVGAKRQPDRDLALASASARKTVGQPRLRSIRRAGSTEAGRAMARDGLSSRFRPGPGYAPERALRWPRACCCWRC
jgi:hypothetical protein